MRRSLRRSTHWRELLYQPRFSTIFSAQRERSLPIRTVEAPCVPLTIWGYNTYGHVLLDALPRICAAKETIGPALKVLMRSDTPDWAIQMCRRFGIEEQQFETYDALNERVLLRRGVYPGYGRRDGMIHPHVARIFDQQPGLLQPNGRSRRCYLLRGNLAARRKLERHCTNEPTLSGVAQIEFGCEIVYPENLGWLEQVALFRSSSLVVGLIGSALHTSVMASDKPTVAFVGLNAMAQPQVARLRHQRYAVLDKDIDARGSYVVSVPAFRRLMEAVS